MSDKIKKREFIRYASKLLVPGEFIVEGKHKSYKVIIAEVTGLSDKMSLSDKSKCSLSDKIKLPKTINSKAEVKKVLSEHKGIAEYGCGCKRVEGKALCPKHNRL